MTPIEELLTVAKARNASDLIVMTGDSPAMRVAGNWQRFKHPKCKPAELDLLAKQLIRPEAWGELQKARSLDFSYSFNSIGRVRCNLHYQRDNLAIVLRLVWPTLPSSRQLGIPDHIIAASDMPDGLILISGPTGSGKSTTLASLVEHINTTRPAHIITIQDPIEFIHANKMSIIEQREIGSDTLSWQNALRNVLRQAPDIIVLGELRDMESINIALTAAETGHLVMASVHASTAPGAVARILDVFPPSQIQQIRLQLSQSLRMVFAQQLVSGIKPESRALLYESLTNTPAVSNLIRVGELEQLPNMISAGRDYGMISFTQCEQQLTAAGQIPPSNPVISSTPKIRAGHAVAV